MSEDITGEVVQVYVSFDRLPTEIQHSMPHLRNGKYALVRVEDE